MKPYYPEIEALDLQDTDAAILLGQLNFDSLTVAGQLELAVRLEVLQYHRYCLIRNRALN